MLAHRRAFFVCAPSTSRSVIPVVIVFRLLPGVSVGYAALPQASILVLYFSGISLRTEMPNDIAMHGSAAIGGLLTPDSQSMYER